MPPLEFGRYAPSQRLRPLRPRPPELGWTFGAPTATSGLGIVIAPKAGKRKRSTPHAHVSHEPVVTKENEEPKGERKGTGKGKDNQT